MVCPVRCLMLVNQFSSLSSSALTTFQDTLTVLHRVSCRVNHSSAHLFIVSRCSRLPILQNTIFSHLGESFPPPPNTLSSVWKPINIPVHRKRPKSLSHGTQMLSHGTQMLLHGTQMLSHGTQMLLHGTQMFLINI